MDSTNTAIIKDFNNNLEVVREVEVCNIIMDTMEVEVNNFNVEAYHKAFINIWDPFDV